MAITKGDILKKRVVSSQIKQAMEQPQSQELQSVLKRTVQQQPIVTNNIRQQVEGTMPSTPQSQELQSIQDRTEQQMAKQKAMQKRVVTEQIKQAVENTPTPTTTVPTAESDPYAFFESYIKSQQPTPEELEKERKREKRKAIFNAIGDGVSSLANLYFTTKGAPNSYNPADNMTRAQRERYEKLQAERKADEEKYMNAYLRLAQLRDSANWRKQQRADQQVRYKVADEQWTANQERLAAAAAADADADRQEREFKHKQDEAEKNRGIRKAEIDARKAHNAATLAETRRYHDIVADNKEKTTASKLRGKELVFSDGKKQQFKIYENVWKASMPQVLDVLLKDPAVLKDPEASMTAMLISSGAITSVPVIDNFVKQNYGKSPTAVKMMEAFSKYDPAAVMGSQEESEEIIDYNPDDEIIDWSPEN